MRLCSRYLRMFSRKWRFLLLCLVALSTTAFVAHQHGKLINDKKLLRNANTDEWAKKAESVESSSPEAKPYEYPRIKQTKGEYDMFDIYKEQIAGSHSNDSRLPEATRSKNKEKLRVFVLPFTHVDPGWLRTFDSYSNDTNNILSNMHAFMVKNEKMRFMWAEFVFFERWWSGQNDTVKEDVRGLVSSGRLELASGSWVMTDEANAIFPVSVDNIIEGLQFIYREFGVKPSVVWSNDPFGYSTTVPYLFKQAGLKRSVINRIHHGAKGFLQQHRAIPFRWRQYFDDSTDSEVLTHVLPYTHYDILNSCGPNPSSCCEFDFKRMTHWGCPETAPVPITEGNVKAKAATLVSQLEQMSDLYESPVLLMMHGDDFRFDMIEEWHQQHDNFLPVFEEINKGNKAEIRFGTFSDYFGELEKWNEQNQVKPATLTGDFFPYKCALGDMWTGYFTTRPFVKRQGRILHSLIRAADLLSAQSGPASDSDVIAGLTEARRTLSLFQHHDAITGTSRRHVMKDYSHLLQNASNIARSLIERAIGKEAGSKVTVTHYSMSTDKTMTKLPLAISKGNNIFVHVYNPLPYLLEDTVSLRVDSSDITVNVDGEAQKVQVEPYVHHGEIAKDTYMLTVRMYLRPLSTVSFELVPGRTVGMTEVAPVVTTTQFEKQMKMLLPSIFQLDVIKDSEVALKTSRLETAHDEKTGQIKSIAATSQATPTVVNVSLVAYRGSGGGAYLMKTSEQPKLYGAPSPPRLLVRGSLQQSLHLFAGNVYERVVAKEVQGPLGAQIDMHLRVDVRKETNTEVALRLETNWHGATVYADSVGMQLLRRERHSSLDVAANYYPMPSSAILDSGGARLTVTSNVEHGMMPLEGGMEIMLDRMLNQDDGKGLGATADAMPTDMLPVDMVISLLLEDMTQPSPSRFSALSPFGLISVQSALYPPVIAIGSESASSSRIATERLPCDFQLLTVRPIDNERRLLILYRNGARNAADGVQDDKETHRTCGNDATAWLRNYLSGLKINTVQETNLSGIDKFGPPIQVSQVKVALEPYKFLSLIIS